MPTRQLSLRHFWRIPAAVVITGLALYFTQASLDVFSGGRGPTRVAMLPAWTELAALVLIALLGCAGLAFATRRWRDRAAREGRAAQQLADIFVPLIVVIALVLPYLPFVSDWLPILRVLAGRGKYLLWTIVAVHIVWNALERRHPPRLLANVRGGVVIVFVAASMAFGAAAWRLTGSVLFPGGDEPHYLVIAQSLWRDHDLKIENNHARRDYAEYYQGTLRPHYQTRGRDGAIYSIHPIGLPVILAPIYAVGGYRGVVGFLIVIGALTSALMWKWVRGLTGSAVTATFAWAAVALSAPFLLGSFVIYPEMAAALCVLAAFTSARGDAPGWRWVIAGLAIAALPWLSTKYAPMAVALWGVSVWRARRSRTHAIGRTAMVSFTLAASLVAWFAFFFVIWGSPLPTSPYAGTDQMQFGYFVVGAPGLLFDQEYGVIAYAPVLFLGLTGFWTMWRRGARDRVLALEIAAVFASLLATVSAYHIWWGGDATPGRPLVSGLALLAAPVAWQYEGATQPARRAAHRLLLVASIWITAVLVLAQSGFLLVIGRSGVSPLLEWLSPDWPLWALAPSFIYHDVGVALAVVIVWLMVVLLLRPVLDFSRNVPSGVAALTATASVGAAIVAVSIVMPWLFGSSLHPPPSLEARGRVPMLDGYDRSRRPIAIVYDPVRRIPSTDVPSLFALSATPGLRRAPQPIPLLLNARFAFPAGRYVVQIRSGSHDPRGPMGEVALQVGRTGDPVRRWDVVLQPGDRWQQEFSLPIDTSFVGFRAAASIRDGASELRVWPLHVVDAHERITVPEVLGAVSYGSTTVYFHDEQAWFERGGFWTRGGATTVVTLVPAIGQGGTLKVRSGAQANTIVFETDAWRSQLDVPAGSVREIRVPSMRNDGLVLLRITSVTGFTPVSVQSGSTDQRFLGCWIEIGEDGHR